MLVGTVSSEACLCDTEADGFLVVRHHKACAHVTGEAQSSHVRNAPINASEQTETVSLASKVIGQSAFATASARLVRDRYLNRMQIAWEIPCQGGGRGRSDDSKSRAVRISILRLAVQMIIVKNENHLPKTRRRRRAGGLES